MCIRNTGLKRDGSRADVCVRERETERDRERGRERGRERDRERDRERQTERGREKERESQREKKKIGIDGKRQKKHPKAAISTTERLKEERGRANSRKC